MDAYLGGIPAGQRDALQRVRDHVRGLVPDATETFSYGMPAFKLGRKFLVSYAGWKAHCSIYPLTDSFLAEHRAELERFGKTKGSLHFTPDEPLPDDLLDGLIRARAEDVQPI